MRPFAPTVAQSDQCSHVGDIAVVPMYHRPYCVGPRQKNVRVELKTRDILIQLVALVKLMWLYVYLLSCEGLCEAESNVFVKVISQQAYSQLTINVCIRNTSAIESLKKFKVEVNGRPDEGV